jgi:hypothetical protein
MERAVWLFVICAANRVLTRRANQAQINTIEDYMARAAKPAAGFLFSTAESCNASYGR